MEIQRVLRILEQIAPLGLAEEWDNVGLLVGSLHGDVGRVMTTLDVTDATIREAIDKKADLIVSHHPVPFRPLKRVVDEAGPGRLICAALRNGISIYSPHTAWDNVEGGINDQLAFAAGVSEKRPLATNPSNGTNRRSARIGSFATPVAVETIVQRIEAVAGPLDVRLSCDPRVAITRLAICCGSGGSYLPLAISQGANGFLTGEATHHQFLEARAAGVALITVGHHASEAFSMRTFAEQLGRLCGNELHVWHAESDQAF